MKNLIKKIYPCSMLELYSICTTAIGNFLLFIMQFSAFRAAYNAEYTTDIKKLLSDAKALPDAQVSYEDAEILHGEMVSTGKPCLQNFRLLKRYIIHAFPDAIQQKAKLTSAGAATYKTARDENWESMEGLNGAMLAFIDDNKTALEANENMPATFRTAVDNAGKAFQEKYDAFKLAEQTAESTAAKVKANNDLYQAIMSMLQDGQVIFNNEAEKAQRFVFANLWDLITIQNSGVKLKIKSSSDNMVVADAQVSIQKPGQPAEVLEVDDDGELIRKIAAGPVVLIISAPGKESQTLMLNLDSGSYKSIEVGLQNAA